jgi:hypothetical protein
MNVVEFGLSAATLLGGASAIWFFTDKWRSKRTTARVSSTEREFFVAATVANVAAVNQSFQMRTYIPAKGCVSDLIQNAKVQLAITRSLALTGTPPDQFRLEDISEPVMFAWNLTELSSDLPAVEIPDRRIVIAVFDPTAGWPPVRVAAHTKAALVGKPELKDF